MTTSHPFFSFPPLAPEPFSHHCHHQLSRHSLTNSQSLSLPCIATSASPSHLSLPSSLHNQITPSQPRSRARLSLEALLFFHALITPIQLIYDPSPMAIAIDNSSTSSRNRSRRVFGLKTFEIHARKWQGTRAGMTNANARLRGMNGPRIRINGLGWAAARRRAR